MEVLEKQDSKSARLIAEGVIECSHLYKSFGDHVVLDDFNLVVNRKENVVVMGRSGIGKTVLIKCIIGLIKPDSGTVKVFGKNIPDLSRRELNEMRTRIGFVFQSSALYDSMTVRQNLEFTLRRMTLKEDHHKIDELVHEGLRNVGLERTIDLMPAELSGGMRKRIGIARSLILKPEIVLYDEPTTGLDPITSSEISKLILDLQNKLHTTSIIITHDVELAKTTATRLIFLMQGKALYEGSYEELKALNDPRIKPFFG
jgi:phospholipid/cholesterol/gamma-HCH transport system ATP-binding protein